MKNALKLSLALLLLALVLVPIIGCGTDGTDDETSGTRENEMTGDTDMIDTSPNREAISLYEDGTNPYLLVGFNEQGRSFGAVTGRKTDKDVGIFYHIWLGQHWEENIYDMSKILDEHGKDVAFHQTSDISPEGHFHWWSEPLYGYYNSGDEWVIRRHMELLTSAGVDFLVFDATNCWVYEGVAEKIMRISSELRSQGWDAPQVAFITHSRSIQTIEYIYNNLYAKNLYPDSWYLIDGRPLIIGYTSAKLDMQEAATRGDYDYKPNDLSKELQAFFHVRQVRWPNDPVVKNGWPYTEWSYPQPLNTDMVSVSLASHPMVPFSFSLTRENWKNWGRGYNPITGQNSAKQVNKGLFFSYQWKTALDLDPRYVMVTGWNEWVAIKTFYDGEYAMVDNADIEYSRDAELMKGGYEDAFFIQMADYIRQYKYTSAKNTIAAKVCKTIDIHGDLSQWDDIDAIYRRVGSDDGSRDSVGGASSVHYRQDAVENNLTEIRVSADKSYLYFYIRAEEGIVLGQGDNAMNLFIGVGSKPKMKGWEGYDFVIGRSRQDGKASIEVLSSDYSGEILETSAEYALSGNVMQIKVPRKALGLSLSGDFYFKVADGVSEPSEIMNYYTSGRAMPVGRLSYLYQIDKMEQ